VSNIEILQLRAGGVSLVLDCSGPGLPSVLHWGADLGELTENALLELRRGAGAVQDGNGLDENRPIAIVPEYSSGWFGLPGLNGHRDGQDFSASFELTSVAQTGNSVRVGAADAKAGLRLLLTVELTDSGLVRSQADLTNTGTTPYTVDGLYLALPVPTEATELLDMTGRHIGERHPQRHAFTQGAHIRDNRRGRTGADATLLLLAGTESFGFRTGEIWGVHTAWSGNHRSYAERGMSGYGVIGGGELLLPGEGRIAPDGTYSTPWIYGSYGVGLDQVSHRFHDYLRARANHPKTERPVVLNTWEAVYFDHDLATLTELAERAQEVGVERFVLDDGWFRHRRDDTAGLGDWYVDEGVWPGGLAPLIDAVTSRGMKFGLWVEPEMVNEDSDVIRAHPDWISGPGTHIPPQWRNQQVLDLVNPEAWQYIYDRLDALLNENDISYLKWDQNRDLTEAGHNGQASTHEQTLAAYRLFDALRAAHPDVEIESCSSGGARVDLGILERTDRVWASDCNDALERQTIQRWTQSVLPPELVGSHVGPPTSHTTGRTHDLSFRAATALFGHFGMEWDIREAEGEVLAELKDAVALYKKHRALLHSGVAVHADLVDPAYLFHGVVAQDASEALFAFVSVASSFAEHPGRVQFPGLDPERRYRVRVAFPSGSHPFIQRQAPGWLATGFEATGLALAKVGLPMPILNPEHAIVLEVVAA